MVQLAYVIASILSIVIGGYAIIMLHQLRIKYKFDYLDSFFYHQLLIVIFGVYGILGSLLIREILPKFGLSFQGIEAISHFIPFLGLPFLIAAWYMLIKMAIDFTNRKLPQFIGIAYFVLSTVLFFLFGLYLLNLSDIEIEKWAGIRNQVYVGFALLALVVELSVAAIVLLTALLLKKNLFAKVLLRVALLLIVYTVLKSLSLYFYDVHFTFGIYFIVLYFVGLLPVILVIRKYLEAQKIPKETETSYKEQLFEKYNITPREKEIIEEICKGKANKEISECLFITLQTVKDHTHNIYQKTEVKNRVQLAKLFSEPSA